jgi:hypothetical protein
LFLYKANLDGNTLEEYLTEDKVAKERETYEVDQDKSIVIIAIPEPHSKDTLFEFEYFTMV